MNRRVFPPTFLPNVERAADAALADVLTEDDVLRASGLNPGTVPDGHELRRRITGRHGR